MTRREFCSGAALALFPPFSWFRPRGATMGGARFREMSRRPRGRRKFFWVHGNEQTARETLVSWLEKRGGTALLTPARERYIPVEGGRIDPNRMFSRTGAEKSLRSLNRGWNDEQVRRALDRLDRDRPGMLKRLLPADRGLLIALHNNSGGYSVEDEVPISDRTSLPRRGLPHEFLLCTDPADFEVLSRSPFNVVLQQKAPAEDDGSLSRLAAARGIRYLNIEAGLGKFPEQWAMLEWADQHLAAGTR